jgi:hypothetical protein
MLRRGRQCCAASVLSGLLVVTLLLLQPHAVRGGRQARAARRSFRQEAAALVGAELLDLPAVRPDCLEDLALGTGAWYLAGAAQALATGA